MSKKNILTILGAAAMMCTAWVGSDTIDEADRFVRDEVPTPWNFEVTTDTLEVEGQTWHVQRVHRLLIEDYTGFMCVNCPDMASFIESTLIDDVDSLAIVVGMHMEGNSLSTTAASLSFQLSTAEAAAYGEALSGQTAANIGLPAVAVDRVTNSNSSTKALCVGTTEANLSDVKKLSYSQYSRYNTTLDSDKPNVDLAVNVAAGTEANTYTLSTLVVSDEATTLPLKLQIWVIENGITGIQQTSDGIAIYQHNHVFRASVNGTWGESITLGDDLNAVAQSTLTINSGWKAENCEVVAFVYRDDTNEVLNAVKVELVP